MNSPYSLRLILLICAIASVAKAQFQLHFGVVAGVPLTDTISSTSSNSISPSGSSFDRYHSVTKRLLIGPAFRVELEHGLGIEFDALYQRVNYDHAFGSLSPSYSFQSFEQTTANRWQFPLLLQYSGTLSKTRYFAEIGPSISRIANSRSNIRFSTFVDSSTSSTTTSGAGQGGTLAGITAGAGVDLPFLHRHLRPEFRFSHWFSPSPGAAIGSAYSLAGGFTPIVGSLGLLPPVASPTFRTSQNEASFLLGLTF